MGMFGISTERKLGRAEEALKQQETTIQDVRLSNEVKASVDAMHDADKRKLLARKWTE